VRSRLRSSGGVSIKPCEVDERHTGAGNVKSLDALLDLVLGLVLVRVGQVRHLLEGHDLDAELVPVLLDGVLRIVRAVEVDALGVLARTGVVTADNEVGGAVVLADDGVPDGLAGAAHAHGQGQQRKHGHAVGVAGHQRLVDADTGEVVNVAGLGEADDGVDEDIGLAGAGSADRQLTMGAVHGVARLERDDLLPAELVEVQTQFRGRIPQTDIVVVLQAVDGLELAADVELVGCVVQVLDRGMRLVVGAKDLGGLLDLVGAVDVLDGHDGEVAVVTEVAQRNARAGLHANLVDGCLRDIERDGHGKEVAIRETVLGDDALVVLLVEEACSVSGGAPSKHGKHEGHAQKCPSLVPGTRP
jgi:hypothetical protein